MIEKSLQIELCEEYRELAIFFLNSLPKKLKLKIGENVKSIKHGNERFGDGHYIESLKEIRVGPAPSSTYFLEILGHEIGHAVHVEEEFGYLVPFFDKHSLCDYFSSYLLYGKGKYAEEFEKVYGKRDPKIVEKLQQEIKKNDDKIEEEFKDLISKGFIDEEAVKRIFNREARFLKLRTHSNRKKAYYF